MKCCRERSFGSRLLEKVLNCLGTQWAAPSCQESLTKAFFAGFSIHSWAKIVVHSVAEDELAYLGLPILWHNHVTDHRFVDFILSGGYRLLVRLGL